MALLHQGFKIPMTVAYTRPNADGTRVAGSVESPPKWVSSAPEILNVVPAADGMTADALWISAGLATVTVTADGDLATDKEFLISMSEDFETVAPVVTIGADAGTFTIGEEVAV